MINSYTIFFTGSFNAFSQYSTPVIEGYRHYSIVSPNAEVAGAAACTVTPGSTFASLIDTGQTKRGHPYYRVRCYASPGSGREFTVSRRIEWYHGCPHGSSLVGGGNWSGGECVWPGTNPNNPPSSCSKIGNPISFSLGEKVQTERDYVAKTHSPIQFERFYNSGAFRSQAQGSLGKQWGHTYSRRILFGSYTSEAHPGVRYWEQNSRGGWDTYTGVSPSADLLPESSDYAHVTRANGKSISFRNTNGSWQASYGEKSRLQYSVSEQSWLFATKDNTKETYDNLGRLISIENNQGQIQTLSYELTAIEGGDDNPDTLDRVEDQAGNYFIFSYNSDARLQELTSSSGENFQYSYNANDYLQQVTYLTNNTTRQYHYEDTRFPGKLTGITDENNLRYVNWVYDSAGRAISSSKAGDLENVSVDYTYLNRTSDPRVTVTNKLGKQATYYFTVQQGVRKISRVEGHASDNCAAANQAYTYDSQGFLESKTDWQGNITTYNHNDRGQELSRTEASGTPQARTITTEWHSDFNLPIRIIEPERETIMSYYVNGRLLSRQVWPRSN